MTKTKILYDGDLENSNGIDIQLPVGDLEISAGTPHLLATTQSSEGFVSLSNFKKTQKIIGDNCSLKIKFNPILDLNIVMTEGNITLEKISPSSLKVLLREGGIKLNLIDMTPVTSEIDMNNGHIFGTLQYKSNSNSEMRLKITEGLTNLKFILPDTLGIKTILKNNFVGILDLPKDDMLSNLILLRIDANQGIIKIKK